MTRVHRPTNDRRADRRTTIAITVTAASLTLSACSGGRGGQRTPADQSRPPPAAVSSARPTEPAQKLGLAWAVHVPRAPTNTGSVSDIASDAHGNVYLADGVTSTVRVYGPNGSLVRSWGTPGTGPGQLDFRVPSTGGPLVGGTVAVDPDGTVYVGSPGSGRIQAFDLHGRFLRGWGGIGTGASRFTLLVRVLVGPHGDVYAIDDMPTMDAVQVFSPAGRFLRGYGTFADSSLSTPTLAAVTPDGDVFLADPGLTGNGGVVHPKVIRFGANGRVVGTWGTFGAGLGQFHTPYSVTVDAAGHVFVGDTQSGQVQGFDGDGHPVASYDLSAGESVSPWGSPSTDGAVCSCWTTTRSCCTGSGCPDSEDGGTHEGTVGRASGTPGPACARRSGAPVDDRRRVQLGVPRRVGGYGVLALDAHRDRIGVRRAAVADLHRLASASHPLRTRGQGAACGRHGGSIRRSCAVHRQQAGQGVRPSLRHARPLAGARPVRPGVGRHRTGPAGPRLLAGREVRYT